MAEARRRGPAATVDYRTIADLRYQIRRYLRTPAMAALQAGIEPQQHLLLLQVKSLEGAASRVVVTLRPAGRPCSGG